MKSFVCTFTEKWNKARGCTYYTIRVYQIKRGVPVFLYEETDTFTGDNQLFMESAEKHKILPKWVFQRSVFTSSMVRSVASLREQKIANVTFIS